MDGVRSMPSAEDELLMKRLSTIEHALKRKSVALKALSARVARRHSNYAIPTTDAARLSVLRAEVESLTRSRDEEALKLAAPSSRLKRLESNASPPREPRAAPSTATPDVSDPTPAASSTGAAAAMEQVPLPSLLMSPPDKGASDMAWRAYREAQRRRDVELREGLKSVWKARKSEIKEMHQKTPPRVESKTLAERVAAGRRDGKVLNAELTAQRASEWARHQARLRQIKAKTTKRVDDRIGGEILLAKPLYNLSLTSSTSSPTLSHHRSGSTPRDAFAWPEGPYADAVLDAKHSGGGNYSAEEIARSIHEADPLRYVYSSSHAFDGGSSSARSVSEGATYEQMRKQLKPWR